MERIQKEILPKEVHLARRKTVEKLSHDQLPNSTAISCTTYPIDLKEITLDGMHPKETNSLFLECLHLEGKEGVRQGRLIHHLGLDSIGSVGLPGQTPYEQQRLP